MKKQKNIEYSKTYPEQGNRHSITPTIHSKEDLDNYFKYVLSYISEKMELTHEGSANRFIVIYSIYFHVTHIQPVKKYDFEVENVLIGDATDILVYSKNSKNIMSEFSKLGSNSCLALTAIQDNHLFDIEKRKITKKVLQSEVNRLFK